MQDLLKIQVVDGHSVATGVLAGGPVLDAGARGFVFSKWFADRGHEVYACDPSPDIISVPSYITHFDHRALVGPSSPEMVGFEMGSDPNAWFVTINPGDTRTMKITDYRLPLQWDVVKLNIEGSEYDILQNWPGAISRQIVFSFHEHTSRARGQKECDRIIEQLKQWYVIYNQVWEKRYGCTENYWDILAIRKDLV